MGEIRRKHQPTERRNRRHQLQVEHVSTNDANEKTQNAVTNDTTDPFITTGQKKASENDRQGETKDIQFVHSDYGSCGDLRGSFDTSSLARFQNPPPD